MRIFAIRPEFSAWQTAARTALQAGLAPANVGWRETTDDQAALGFQEEPTAATTSAGRHFRVPRAFPALAECVACHRRADRWAILYRVLWRLTHDEPHLLEVTVDPDVHALRQMEKAVRRDVHKMRAFVRFREITADDGAPWFVAWFEPTHFIVERNASFFVDRFASQRWSILTPDRCAHWDGATLHLTPGVPRSAAPAEDPAETLWRTYYASIFNPARVKVRAMQAEMPRKYWRNLPEAGLIPGLLEAAPVRVAAWLAREPSDPRPET